MYKKTLNNLSHSTIILVLTNDFPKSKSLQMNNLKRILNVGIETIMRDKINASD